MKQSTQAGDSIRELADSISQGAQAAVQIAASSQEQLIAIEQVVTALESINLVSNQNLAGSKQLNVSAQNLKELGITLKELISQYQM